MAAKKILIVDDEPVVAKLLKRRFEFHGFNVETATEGVTALEKVKAWQPDLVLLDIVIPGMDGYEICRRLKATKGSAHIPVIFFTASQGMQSEEIVREVGAVRMIQKPFVDQVFEAISKIFSSDNS